MASRIKGITVENGGDITGLDKALKSVNSSIKTTQSSLRDVNKLLKLDPTNTELLTQKQKLLKEVIETTKEKLDALKSAQEQAKTAFSALECAEALNYLALAGYNTQQMCDTPPTVLNLAAAGDIDLASASDMVTDAMSALGMGTDEATTMVDQMSKTTSTTNTSVEMFENIAYIMTKHADPSIPDSPEEWLDEFSTFSIYQVLPKIIELCGLNVQSEVESKKNTKQLTVR